MDVTDLAMLFLFFEPGGRPRRFAFLAMETSMIGDGHLYFGHRVLVMPPRGRTAPCASRPTATVSFAVAQLNAGQHSTATSTYCGISSLRGKFAGDLRGNDGPARAAERLRDSLTR